MKTNTLNLTWCVLHLCLLLCLNRQTSGNDDLDDFDFLDFNADFVAQDAVEQLQQQQQQYQENIEHDKKGVAKGVVNAVVNAAVGDAENLQNTNNIPLGEDWSFEDDQDNAVPGEAFNYREKLLRKALAKALSNVSLRQRFVEVMPILRVLNAQQRLALSALISAQMQKQHDQPLKLEEVRKMFGDDRKLLLPIMFDIANLVSSSAYKYLPVEEPTQATWLLERREFDLLPEEEAEEKENEFVGISSDIPDDMLDPQDINDQLQATQVLRRKRRSDEGTQLVHKLIRAVPLSAQGGDEQQIENEGRMLKVNTTAFQGPFQTVDLESDLAYQQVEDMALGELENNNSTDADEHLTDLPEAKQIDADEALPQPEAIISGHRYRLNANKVRVKRPKPVASRKRVQIQARPKSGAPAGPPLIRKCERFTASMCIRTDDYPLEQIMGSIRRHKNAMTALLAEYRENPLQGTDFGEDFEDFPNNKKRRGDEGVTGGGMCQSIVRYARPQKARSASGEWKYIVNTGQHTQTLRLEKCTNPQESCSYLAHNYRSHCTQVYNYHRLLSWDKTRGLHVDIFKVPTCCTCQVDGYRQQFPPLAAGNNKDFTPSQLEPYSTINEELDYNDEEDEDDLSYHFSSGFSKFKGREPNDFDVNELQSSSKTIRSKVFPPRPTVGSYLSPPEHEEYETQYGFQSAVGAVGGKTSKNLLVPLPTRRRPYKSLGGVDDKAAHDLEISPSEIHQEKEVKLFGSEPPKQRKPIYSVPHTASASPGSGVYPSSSRTGSSNSKRAFQQPGSGHTTTSWSHAGKTTGGRTAIQQASSISASHAYGGDSRISSKPQSPRPKQAASAKTSSSPSNLYTSTPATASTPSTTSAKSNPTAASIFHVNAMNSAKLNSSTGSKRVNYSYHPIIDFFEVNKRTQVSSTTQSPAGKQLTSLPPVPYVHTIPKVGGQLYQTHHERRIGFGAAGGHEFSDDSNSWRPMVLTT